MKFRQFLSVLNKYIRIISKVIYAKYIICKYIQKAYKECIEYKNNISLE